MSATSKGIEGKVVVITGASSGIGEVTARELASRGAKVVLGARRTDRLESVASEIRDGGGSAVVVATDVTKREDVEKLVEAAVENFGHVDVMLNNAGVMPLSPLSAGKVDEWERMVDVNIKGVLYGIAAALPRMKERGSGHVINVSSVAGHVVFPSSAVYCGTKFAVRAISEGLRQEEDSIRVTIISPGATASELADSITHSETRDSIAPIVGMAIPAEAIARAIAFAIEQPDDVDVNEVLVRPTKQPL
ncbi:MAG: oxidoreductase [Phycisphaerae bacterium]|nr:oxidoreductase [Phycisphaerae bacterium]